MKTTTLRLGLPALLLAAACSSRTGTMSVHLVDAPADYEHIYLHIVRVEAHSDVSGWFTLSDKEFFHLDLLSLRDGVSATLADKAPLAAGRYTQLRLVLGDGNKVVLKGDTTEYDLTVPSGLQTGVKLVCNVDVQEGSDTDVVVDVNGPHSILLHDTGVVPTKYILRPVVFCAAATTAGVQTAGSISGTLSGKENIETPDVALEGVEVTAQVVESGEAAIVQSTITDSDGIYRLDNLPFGHTYYVVSQPLQAGNSWAAKASGPIALSSSHPTDTWDSSFGDLAATGDVNGTITWASTPDPSPTDPDQVWARQSLGAPQPLIVRTTDATTPGVFAFLDLPIGSYTLSATRTTGTGTVESQPPVSVTVTPGVSTPAAIAFP
ncbi:MAG TPA: DUF4382 domain-containing protein [Anaeromyxobacteraceae bacterium]|nr:DUF4382 domain-containing protein [Anaeromyxobacteraceae bacterium]